MSGTDGPPSEVVDGGVAYDVPFVDDSSHAHMVALLREHARPGVIVDVGCGYAPHAEPLRERGFRYVGVDADAASVASLRERGFIAEVVDADDPEVLIDAFDRIIAGLEGDDDAPPVSAVLALDVLEHLVSPHVTLRSIVGWMRAHAVPVLGLSLPNVSHQDVALKLLAGRFDMTPTGLLDHTHVRFFTDATVATLVAQAGATELARHDVRSPKSDQDWPEQHPMLSDGALLGTYLRRVRARGDQHGATFQFVRLFAPVESDVADDRSPSTLIADRPPSPTRAITAIVAPGLSDDVRSSLHDEFSRQSGGLVTEYVLDPTDDLRAVLDGVDTAYVSLFVGGERLAPSWATSVLAAADRYPAAVIRSGPLDPDPNDDGPNTVLDTTWAERFSPFDHYVDDATPGAALAFPTEFLRGITTVSMRDATAIDTHALLLEASTICGVVDSGAATVAVRRGWQRAPEQVDATVERLSAGALLAPVGAAREIARLRRAETDLVATWAELDRLHGEVAELNAELRRRPVRVVRRAADLVNRVVRRA